MILKVHLEGAPWYEIGDEIWQVSLEDAIRSEAELIGRYAGEDVLEATSEQPQGALAARIVAEMTEGLTKVGDSYRAPDGVLYSLIQSPGLDPLHVEDTLRRMTSRAPEPTVDRVLRFESLPLGSTGSRRAIVRWSDGSEGTGLTWYADEILICEGDLIGKTRERPRSLHFRRDRDCLQS
jgi:hypothetical protein